MTDKLSDKDKKDWENYLKNPGKIEVKDVDKNEKNNFIIHYFLILSQSYLLKDYQ